MPSAQFAEQLAQALLLEQVTYYKQQLLDIQPEQNAHLNIKTNQFENSFLIQLVDMLYQNAQHMQLKQAILPEQLDAVVSKYAFELNLGGELLEFIAVAARRVHLYLSQSESTLQHLISSESYEFWLNKCIELESLREQIATTVQHQPKFKQLSLYIANRLLEQQTTYLDPLRKAKLSRDSVRMRLLSFLQEQQQQLEFKLEQQLADFMLQQVAQYIQLKPDELNELGKLIWSNIKDIHIKDYIIGLSEDDIEDFFILIYESWRELRQHQGLQQLILSVVQSFYTYFAEHNLQQLIHAVGLKQQDLRIEMLRFAPYFIAHLEQPELLEPLLMQVLKPFYTRIETLEIIQQHMTAEH